MVYPELNSTLVGSNVMQLMLYANTVTHSWFGIFLVFGFFIITLLGSIGMQFRFSSQIDFKISLLASSFATLGWATIIEMTSGMLSPVYFYFIIGVTILAFIWSAVGD